MSVTLVSSTLSSNRNNGVWLIFFMLGLGTLLPWNFFMTATMYFSSRLRDPSQMGTNLSGNGNGAEGNNRSLLEAKFNNVMTLCAMVPLLAFTCLNSVLHQRIPQKFRIMGSLAVILVVFLLTAILVKIEMAPLPFFTLTMIKIVIINSFGAILQGSLFGMAGQLPTKYTTPIMSGQGLAGTFAAFSMICAISSGSEINDAAFGYFITACVVILLAIISYVVLPKLEFYQYYKTQSGNRISDEENKLDLLKKELYFIPVCCFLLFNLSDWVGRSLTAVCMWPGKDSKLVPILLVARVIFVPLFMLCNVQPRYNLPIFFEHDAWFIVFMIVFAFSNGYLASLCMCFGPKKVAAHEAETAGAIMAFFMSLGLALGASLSFLFRGLV
uniref:Solute carrier family 29 member 1 (Augustine blood group) n=1 Tax=Oncorhynchus kisutch TaxID=8019 RepID=A0A8C7D9V1_ONCKI